MRTPNPNTIEEAPFPGNSSFSIDTICSEHSEPVNPALESSKRPQSNSTCEPLSNASPNVTDSHAEEYKQEDFRSFVLQSIVRLDELDVWKALYDCFQCHHSRWKLGIYHRDINLNNLVSKSTSDEVSGMLIDFDLAIRKEDVTATYNRRVGTLPFMAMDLAREWGFQFRTDPVYRFDTESFFWVLVWIITQFGDEKRRRHIHSEWQEDSHRSSQARLFLLWDWTRSGTTSVPSSIQHLRSPILQPLIVTYTRMNTLRRDELMKSSRNDADQDDNSSEELNVDMSVEEPDDYMDEILKAWQRVNRRLASKTAT
ncbi:hypothetical protein CPB86DRAFT_878804 [Serendipita vermifera]|nr:hypothetical protein CPB86DRAFT_878804 [Serendipita vermifera]